MLNPVNPTEIGMVTSFNYVCSDIRKHGLQAAAKEWYWNMMNIINPQSILCSESSDGCHAIATVGCDYLEVCLNSGSTRGIRAGNRENSGDGCLGGRHIERVERVSNL